VSETPLVYAFGPAECACGKPRAPDSLTCGAVECNQRLAREIEWLEYKYALNEAIRRAGGWNVESTFTLRPTT
jgi:hypothetical protein